MKEKEDALLIKLCNGEKLSMDMIEQSVHTKEGLYCYGLCFTCDNRDCVICREEYEQNFVKRFVRKYFG